MNLLFNRKYNDVLEVCGTVLQHAGVKFTRSYLLESLERHPDYPSLLSVKDVLGEYGVDTAAIHKGEHSYSDFETPFICSIQQNDWPRPSFTVVNSAAPSTIQYLDPIRFHNKKVSDTEFNSMDKEIVLLLDVGKGKDEVNYETHKQKERLNRMIRLLPIWLALIAVVSAGLYMFVHYAVPVLWWSLLYLLTSTVGLAVSILLLWHEIDNHNPFLKEVCGGQGEKMNCNAVLDSDGAHFLNIPWSLWGGAYFGSFFLSMTLFAAQQEVVHLWRLLSILVAPYILYSVYYQGRILKQWCPLCLSVQAILLINVFASLIAYGRGEKFFVHIYSSLVVVILGLTVLIIGHFGVPMIKQFRESRSYERKWKRMRHDPDIFNYLLRKSVPINEPYNHLGIVLGNSQARNEIIKVCNPYCGPCSKAHPILEEILTRNTDVKLRIIFTATGEDDDLKTKAVKLFLAVRDKYGQTVLKKLLDQWYGAGNVRWEDYQKEYKIKEMSGRYVQEIREMRKWCDAMKIRATPTLFINGYELPEGYRIEELKNFL